MTIKQQGGVFGRNPAFNTIDVASGDSHLGEQAYVQSGSMPQFSVYNLSGERVRLRWDTNAGRGVIGTQANGDFRFERNGGEIFTLKTTGIAMANGLGIDFSATSGTGTSELFDDYEEGTWTVELYDAASAGNVSPTTATGYYTKIGRQVSITFSLSNIDTTGMTSGNVLYFTLPFTAGFVATGSLVLESFTLSAGRTWVAPWINAADTRGRFRQSGDAVIAANLTVGSINSGGSDIERCTLTYFVG